MDQRVQIALALLKEDLRKELSPDDLARAVNLSPSRFRHIFKAEVGTSPRRYLHTLRLEYARELLETSLLSVKQIVACIGINDRSHFDREFKRAYGLSPIRYRAAHPLVGSHEQPRL
jgi:AraC family transcriptional regulator, arabinose operon regulatory protein